MPNFTENKTDRAYESFMKQIPGFQREPPEAKEIQQDLERKQRIIVQLVILHRQQDILPHQVFPSFIQNLLGRESQQFLPKGILLLEPGHLHEKRCYKASFGRKLRV